MRGHHLLILLGVLILAPMVVALALVSSASLPSLEGRTVTKALSAEQARATALGFAIQPLVAAHPDVSGLHLLDAF